MTHVYPGNIRLARMHLALGHLDRAYELDPTLRPRQPEPLAFDADAIIGRAISKALKSCSQPTSLRRPSMPRRRLSAREINAIFQRGPDDPLYRYERSRAYALDADRDAAASHVRRAADYVAAVAAGDSELDAKRLRDYLDAALAETDSADVTRYLEHARNHVRSVAAGASELDAKRLRGYLEDALLECLGEEGEDERDEVTSPTGFSGQTRLIRGRDNVGEVGPRSSVTREGLRRRIDHRKDFRALADGGAESPRAGDIALAYDEKRLFQR